jgi:hypothetical protein
MDKTEQYNVVFFACTRIEDGNWVLVLPTVIGEKKKWQMALISLSYSIQKELVGHPKISHLKRIEKDYGAWCLRRYKKGLDSGYIFWGRQICGI